MFVPMRVKFSCRTTNPPGLQHRRFMQPTGRTALPYRRRPCQPCSLRSPPQASGQIHSSVRKKGTPSCSNKARCMPGPKTSGGLRRPDAYTTRWHGSPAGARVHSSPRYPRRTGAARQLSQLAVGSHFSSRNLAVKVYIFSRKFCSISLSLIYTPIFNAPLVVFQPAARPKAEGAAAD